MKTQELENRLKNFETLSFVNDIDLFEFTYTKIRGGYYRVMRNGKFRPNRLYINDIMQIISVHKLQLEEV